MIKLAENTITKEELINLSNWIPESPQLTKGPLTVEFEKQFAKYIGTEYCVMVNSGSSANLLMAYALLEGNYLRNKKVVVPAISWITTLSPFMQFNFETFLCDCDKKNLGIDTEMLEDIFIREKPALLILVHVLAHLNNIDEINRLCKKYDVIVIEDACEALGTSYNNKKAGNLSLAGSFSFYYGHHISTIEGGAVTTNDHKLYNLMLSIRSHGWSRDVDDTYKKEWKEEFDIDTFREFYSFYYPGFNLRSSDLNAFLGINQLKKMDEIVKVREHNYNLYCKYLSPKYWVQTSKYDELSSFAFGTLVENRLEVYEHLKNKNIETRPLICGSMGRQPFWIKKFGVQNLKVADIIHDFGMYLPNHLYLDENDISLVCKAFNEIAIPLHIDE